MKSSVARIDWKRDGAAEETMNQLKIGYSVADMKLSEIDWKQSKENRARVEWVNVEHKDSIKHSMETNCSVPMIVVNKTPSGHVIVSGNHRGLAAREFLGDHGEIPVFVVQCTPSEFEVLSVMLNMKNGMPINRDEKISKAVEFHRVLGMKLAEACKMLGVSSKAARDKMRTSDFAVAMGVEILPGMQSTIARIPERHLQFEPVMRAYGNLLKSRKNRIGREEMQGIINDVSSAKSESDMVKKLEDFTVKPRAIVVDFDKPRTDLIKAIERLAVAVDKAKEANVSMVGIVEEKRKEVVEKWIVIKRNIGTFL
jgi:hypothetical protein